MRKIQTLLDETTVINFPFLFKIVKNYKNMAFLLAIVFAVVGYNTYIQQRNLYLLDSSFDYISNKQNSTSQAIYSMLGEQSDTLSEADVIGLVSTLDFLNNLSLNIVERPEFQSLDFNNIYSKEYYTFDEIFGACANSKECFIEKLRGILPTYFTIIQDPIVRYRFNIKIKTRAEKTSKIILEALKDTMNEHRRNSMIKLIQRQRFVSNQLLEQKQSDVPKNALPELNEQFQMNKGIIDELNRKTQTLNRIILEKKIEIQYLKSKLNQSGVDKKYRNKEVKQSNEDVESFQALIQEIQKIKKDINSIETSSANLAAAELNVLKELKSDLAKKSTVLKNFESLPQMIASTPGKALENSVEFNRLSDQLKVLITQVQELEKDLAKYNQEKDVVEEKMKDIQEKIMVIKPNIKYLEKIEEKLIALELLETTIVSDFHFADISSPVAVFKRTSSSKIVLFSIALYFFFLFVCVVLRYLIDPKIHDIYEIQRNFSDLEILGRTPQFD